MEKNSKRNKIRAIIITLGCCCIIAAAALSAYNYMESKSAAEASQELTTRLSEMLVLAKPQETDPADEELSLLPEGTEAEAAPEARKVDGYNVCGILSMPSINIQLAIIQEWSYPNLNISACRYSGTPEEQMILLAHNYRNHFGKLSTLEVGDRLTFTDVFGVEFTYEVTGTEIWATNQLRQIISGDEWDLTLFTCTYGGANRVVVRCDRIENA